MTRGQHIALRIAAVLVIAAATVFWLLRSSVHPPAALAGDPWSTGDCATDIVEVLGPGYQAQAKGGRFISIKAVRYRRTWRGWNVEQGHQVRQLRLVGAGYQQVGIITDDVTIHHALPETAHRCPGMTVAIPTNATWLADKPMSSETGLVSAIAGNDVAAVRVFLVKGVDWTNRDLGAPLKDLAPELARREAGADIQALVAQALPRREARASAGNEHIRARVAQSEQTDAPVEPAIDWAEDFRPGEIIGPEQAIYMCLVDDPGPLLSKLIGIADDRRRQDFADTNGCRYSEGGSGTRALRIKAIANSLCVDRQAGWQETQSGREATTLCGREGRQFVVDRDGVDQVVLWLSADQDFD